MALSVKPRAAAKAATRDRVLAAARAAFEHRGYEAATIRLIGRAAGLSTGAIFSNFLDKAALYQAVYGQPVVTQQEARELRAELEALRQGLAQAEAA